MMNKSMRLRLGIALVFCLVSWMTFGQRVSGGFERFNQSSGSQQGQQPQDQFEVPPDTADIFYYFADNPNLEYTFEDTLLSNYFQQYDPVRQRDLDYMHLGNLGSAHQPIVYEPTMRQGFDLGLHQYDLYRINGAEFPFYRVENAFTNLAYYQGGQQADGYIKADFSRNFANGVTFNINYDRISQLGTANQYPNQNSRNTSFGLGTSFISSNQRYSSFFSLTRNTIEQEDNGGILREPQNEGDLASPTSAQVFLNTAQTRHDNQEWRYTHYYKFGGQQDSIKGQRRAFTLTHQFIFQDDTYKFFATDPTLADSSFFNNFPGLLPDERGSRFFMDYQKVENSFRLATFQLEKFGQTKAKEQKDLLEIGLTHAYHRANMEPRDSTINNLFLTGRWNIKLRDRLRLNTYAHFGLWDHAGDYQLKGTLALDLGKLGNLQLQALNQLYRPNLIQTTFYSSQTRLWKNNFDQTLETNLQATYRLPSIGLEASAAYHLINNFIYFDTDGFARQTGVPVSILQFIVKQDFKLGPMHLDNVFTAQTASEDVIRLPSIYTKHSLYYEGEWFKVLLVRLGVDMRLNTSYFADYYNPLTGQFQLQGMQETELYPAMDAYFSMRVNKFRAFFKWENFSSLWLTDRLFYQTAFYGHPNGTFRLGVKWRFIN